MREAAADLEFETAARLRDEIKRLQETELAVADDPFARQSDIDARTDTKTAKSGNKKAPHRSPSAQGPLVPALVAERVHIGNDTVLIGATSKS